MSSEPTWSRVILLGDSLTQYSFSPDGRWGSLLADKLQRMADVVPRGFGGYNSRWIRKILPRLFDEKQQFEDVSCLTIFLGANDCTHADCPTGMHVPLEEYKNNIVAIVDFFSRRGLEKDKVLLITPPIYFHDDFMKFLKTIPDLPPNFEMKRSNDMPGKYAEACVQVAEDIGVDVVNVHSTFMADGRGKKLLCDGIHFSPDGAQLFFDTLWPHVEKRVLAYRKAETLVENFPSVLDILTGKVKELSF